MPVRAVCLTGHEARAMLQTTFAIVEGVWTMAEKELTRWARAKSAVAPPSA